MKKGKVFISVTALLLILASCSAGAQNPGSSASPELSKESVPASSVLPESPPPSPPPSQAESAAGYYITDSSKDESSDKEGVVDSKGNIILPAEFQSVDILSYNDNPVMFFTIDGTVHIKGKKTHSNGGLYNTKGEKILTGDYMYASALNENFIVLGNENYIVGLVTVSGKTIVPFNYGEIFLCGGCIAAVKGPSGNGDSYSPETTAYIYDMNGRLLRSGNLSVDEDYYYIDDEGSGEYYSDGGYSNYIRIADYNSGFEYGLADVELKTVVEPVWDKITSCGNDEFIVQKGDFYGVINGNGKEILPLEYSDIQLNYDCENALTFYVSSSDGAYIFDKTGRQLYYTDKTDYIDQAEDGILISIDDSLLWHALDSQGNDIIPPAKGITWYDDYQLFECDNGPLTNTYYTKDGTELPLSQFAWCKVVSSDRFLVSKTEDSDYGICDRNGNIIVSPTYIDIEQTDENNNLLIFSLSDEYGVTHSGIMDINGNIILPALFNYIEDEGGGVFNVQTGAVSGLIDINGNWLYRTSVYGSIMD